MSTLSAEKIYRLDAVVKKAYASEFFGGIGNATETELRLLLTPASERYGCAQFSADHQEFLHAHPKAESPIFSLSDDDYMTYLQIVAGRTGVRLTSYPQICPVGTARFRATSNPKSMLSTTRALEDDLIVQYVHPALIGKLKSWENKFSLSNQFYEALMWVLPKDKPQTEEEFYYFYQDINDLLIEYNLPLRCTYNQELVIELLEEFPKTIEGL